MAQARVGQRPRLRWAAAHFSRLDKLTGYSEGL